MIAESEGTSEKQNSNGSIPAWIEAEDLLVKMREELMDRAIKLLNNEIEAGHIQVNGNALFSSEASADVENAVYLINNLIDDSGTLHQRYNEYLSKNEGKRLSEAEAKKFDELQKFVLSVEQLAMLMEYSRVLSSWADDASKNVNLKSVVSILKITIDKDEQRRTVVEFFTNNKDIANGALTKAELNVLRTAIN